MYLLLVFLSIIGSILAGLFGRYLGLWGSAIIIITTGCLFISFLISLFAFYEVALIGCCVYIKLSSWISSEVLNVNWGFMFDSLTVFTSFIYFNSSHDNYLQESSFYFIPNSWQSNITGSSPVRLI